MERIIFTSYSEDEQKTLFREVIVEIKLEQEKLENQTNKVNLNEKLLNPTEVVKLIRISKVTLQKWMKSGKVPYYRLGRKVYFRECGLLDTINLRKNRV